MKAPTSPLWIRILGYGGTTLLVVAAIAVLVFQITGARKGAAGTTGPSAGGPAQSDAPGAGQDQPTAAGGGGDSGGGADDGALTGLSRCGPSTAGYKQSGGTLKVSVTLPPSGVVSASVQLKGQGQPQTKALNVAGEQSPHVFEFTDIAAPQIQSISVSVLTGTDFKSCVLTR